MKAPIKGIYFFLIVIVSLCAGFFFYGIYNEYIIVRLPLRHEARVLEQLHVKRKNVKLYYWNNEKFFFEEKMILYSSDMISTVTELITSWLTMLHEEHPMQKRVNLERVLIDFSGNEAFISFDKYPFFTSSSVFQKLIWIECLLKTVSESGLPLKKVHFLTASKPLVDQHIDFSHSFPITGYLASV